MRKNVFGAIGSAARKLVGNWRAMLAFIVVYALIIAIADLFIHSSEATVFQVILTGLLPILAPILFFILQDMCVTYVGDSSVVALLRRSLGGFWKLALISLPIIALAIVAIYYLGKIPITPDQAKAALPVPVHAAAAHPPAAPTNWMEILVIALRVLILYIALPLSAIHLWIVTAGDGLKEGIKRILKTIGRAFAPSAVLTYIIGLVIFGVIPYFLIETRTLSKNAWLDAGLLGVRLLVAALLILFGWVVTLGALTERQRQLQPAK